MLEADAVAYNGIIVAELLLGTRSEREYSMLKAVLEGLVYLEMNKRFFEEVARNGYLLKRKGITVPLTDLMIATHCLLHGLSLIQQDQHFPLIAQYLDLSLAM